LSLRAVSNASHELRTPLTVMHTAIDVVVAKPEPTHDELVSMAADVRDAVYHAERLIEALLATGVTTSTTLDEAPVTGDGVLLERLIDNLLDNAERYNIAGGTVAISTTSAGRKSAEDARIPARRMTTNLALVSAHALPE
jgi:signal transduction histidine kinase